MAGEVGALLSDVSGFAQLHRVQDKDSKRPIPFRPSPMQRRIFDAVKAGHNRIVILKARQVYATTGAKMVLHWLAYTTPHEAMHAVVSMRDDGIRRDWENPGGREFLKTKGPRDTPIFIG